jgi:hypothetical protein
MRIKFIIPLFILFTGLLAAQPYPLVTLHDINYIPDSLITPSTPWPNSPLTGQTVRVRGQVNVRSIIDYVGNRNPILYFGSHWGSYIQDENNGEWGGLNIYGGDSTLASTINTEIDLIDTAKIYEFTGTVTMYGQTIELALTPDVPKEEVGTLSKRPDPIPLTLDSCQNSDGSFNYRLRKYLGMYVSFTADDEHEHPLVVSDIITGTGSTAGGFKVNNSADNATHSILMYAQSRYFKTGGGQYTERPDYSPPVAGSHLSYIRGILEVYNNQWEVVCVYPDDLGPVLVIPPTITSVRRDEALVASNQAVTVSCVAKGVQADVDTVKMFYRVNGGELDSLVMNKTTADTIFSSTIPGITADSALVDYYIKATDMNGNSITSPLNINTGRYFYYVLNRPITIQEVQYSPFGNGLSAFYNYPVTISGIVTADTAGRATSAGNGAASSYNRIIIQNGETPWSGIWLNGVNTNENVSGLKIGDNVTVSGVVKEDYDVTRIDSIYTLIVNSSGNALPNAQIVTTGSIGTLPSNSVAAEQWESVLIKFDNVTITDVNADGSAGPDGSGGSRNFGEILVNDGSGNVRADLQDGNHFYHNMWDAALADNPLFISVDSGATMTSLSGYLYFSYSYYKLIPRINSDFEGYSTPVGVNDLENLLPYKFVVDQNYPNPFNPSTLISFKIPIEGVVNIRIYNLLGQEVVTVLNEFMSAGTYKVNFNASNLSSGVYFYKVSSGKFSQVKKMMLIK